jgi:concanavalin A-like lectin/glucanase superfamily protein
MTALETLSGRLTLPYRRGAEFVAIPLAADAAGATPFAPYDFAEYRARWGQDPTAPFYVITPRTDVTGDDLILKIAYTFGGVQTATLTIPRATRAGTGFPIPLPSGANAMLRLNSLTVAPLLGIAGRDAWDVVALLGTIAKLVWVLGAEKDALARVRQDVRNARFVKSAFAAALDALGKDMRVPRFPPRPYSIDDATIALWHLDEFISAGPVVDQATQAHPGTVVGAIAGASGKYGTGFAFVASGSAITIAPSTDFNIATNDDATIEAFVTTDIPSDAMPRAIVVRRAAETIAGSNTPGWSLCVVNARGFNANILFALCDGAREVRLFADLSVADGRFHHVAGIIDRTCKRARLFVDGVQRATAPIDALGAIAPPDGVRFGSTAAATNNLSGTVDEVRISRVARATFHPALGEDDDAYRARLRIFRRWVLPTPANVIAMINEAAPFPNDLAPYVLIETNQPTQVAESPVRIVPGALAAGAAIALDGTTPQDETVAGTPADDAGFDPSLDLITYVHAGVDSTSDPGGARMQAGAGFALDALVAAAAPGTLVLEHSFDTAGPTPLHSVGRALRLRPSTPGLAAVAALGALAHRAGFAFVRNLGPDLAVAVPPGERLAIRSAPAALQRADVGSEFDLTIDPPVPVGGTFSWTIVTPGPAHAHFIAHSADPPLLQTLTTSAPTAAANATLHFAAVPATIMRGMAIADLTTGSVIPAGSTVVSTTATTVVMSNNATAAGVGGNDTIQFRDRTPVVSRPRVRLVTDSPGDLAVRVEYGRSRRTRSGTLALHIDPTTLADGHGLDTIGNLDPDPTAIVGTPDPGFDATYLLTYPAQPTIDFGADPNNRKMQVVARDALDALVGLLAARGTPGRLRVTQAFVPGGPGVESVGRRLILGHETLDPGVLGALASRFFDYVTRAGASVTAFVRSDTWIAIGDAATAAPVPAEIVLGTTLNLAVVPRTIGTLTTTGPTAAATATLQFAAVPGTILPGMAVADLTTAAAIPAGTTVVSTTATTVVMSQTAAGAGVATGDVIQFGTSIYNWSTRAIGAGAGSFDTLVRPTARFTPSKLGPLVLALTHVARDDSLAAPYTFEIRLKPALDVPGTFIPKEQYDIIMNVLDAFHPIGVEVRTDHIRKHVREIEQDPTKAFPAYSFPNFRL